MFPAILKNYFETITVSGLTFFYGENGRPKGLDIYGADVAKIMDDAKKSF